AAVGAALDGPLSMRSRSVPRDVRQRLLHDPISRRTHRFGYNRGRTVDLQRDRQVGGTASVHQLGELVETRCWSTVGDLTVVAQQLQHHPELLEHVAAGPLNSGE